jgi:hypothetical protein
MRIILFLCCGILRAASLPEDFDACIFRGGDPYVGMKADRDWPDRRLPAQVDHNDAEYVRNHAWRLFAKVTADYGRDPNGHSIPVWQTWYSFPEISSNGSRKQGPIAGVDQSFFNRDLCAEIRKERLYCPSNLKVLQSLPPGDTREVPMNNVHDAVVKTAWQAMTNGTACVGRWDRQGATSGLNTHLKRNVCVLADGKTPGDCLATCPASRDNPAVSANRFYSIEQDGVRQLLTGLHFVTRETAQWIWGTVWWHPEPNVGPFAAGRSREVRGSWRNYLLDVAYDMDRPYERDGGPAIVYNPFLEGGLAGGTRSNCVTCHRRAVWPAHVQKLYTPDSEEVIPFWNITVRGSEAAARTYIPDYAELLKLHFIWHLTFPTSGAGCQAAGN